MSIEEKRPEWFEFPLSAKLTLDQLSDEELGKAVKAAMAYFDTKTVPELDGVVGIAFNVLKYYIDRAFIKYAKNQANGKYGADVRYGREPPPYHP